MMPLPGRSVSVLTVLFMALWISGCFNGSFYYPDDTVYKTPAAYGLAYEEVSFRSGDGTRLYGWFIPATGTPAGTIVYFYGNFANRTYYLKHVHWFPRMGFNVFTFDFRGFGLSEGAPSRSGIYRDSVAAIEYLMSKPGIDSGNIFIYGQSLGGAFAIAALAENQFPGVRAAAVEGTFTSFRAEAAYMMMHNTPEVIRNVPCLLWPIRPVTFLGFSDDYNPVDRVDRVSPVPLLIIHCISDTAVPHAHAEQLYERAKPPKYLWSVEGCEHVNLFINREFSDEYRRKLVDFFKSRRSESPHPLFRKSP